MQFENTLYEHELYQRRLTVTINGSEHTTSRIKAGFVINSTLPNCK